MNDSPSIWKHRSNALENAYLHYLGTFNAVTYDDTRRESAAKERERGIATYFG